MLYESSGERSFMSSLSLLEIHLTTLNISGLYRQRACVNPLGSTATWSEPRHHLPSKPIPLCFLNSYKQGSLGDSPQTSPSSSVRFISPNSLAIRSSLLQSPKKQIQVPQFDPCLTRLSVTIQQLYCPRTPQSNNGVCISIYSRAFTTVLYL